MANINAVSLTGNLTRDVEIRTTESGLDVANAAIAVNGFKEGDTSFVELVFFDKIAGVVSKYASKGQKIGVTGRLKQESWNDKETGKQRSRIVVVVNDLDLPPRSESGQTVPQKSNDVVLEDIDDKPIDLSEIPF